VRHQHERDGRAVEDDVVLVQPVGEVTLDVGAAVAELGQLDQVLELQVVDVVDQPVRRLLPRSAVPLRLFVRLGRGACPGRDSNPQALSGNGF
jgi:hypothetical protein